MRTVPGHVLWCSAEGSPPINISLLKDSTSLDNGIGKAWIKIYKEGIYTCLARNEAGSDSREIRVTLVGASLSAFSKYRIYLNKRLLSQIIEIF